jgi:hypothetical protein
MDGLAGLAAIVCLRIRSREAALSVRGIVVVLVGRLEELLRVKYLLQR